MLKVCKKDHKPRQVFLFNDLLLYGEKWIARGKAKVK